MKKTKRQLFALALALWGLSSCSQDASDVHGSATGGETVTFSLNAEVSVDDPSLRAIDYKLGTNAKGQLVPMPQFTDGQEVEVHTVLKSTDGAVAAETLKWRYDATKKKLVLKQNDGHNITVSGFNNDNGVKWYISGLIGGVLNGTMVEFMGTRVLKGVDGNVGDALGSMEVPYAFGWTELTIDTSSSKDSEGSHKYAEVPASKSVQFKPMGSLLAVKLGSNQSAGAYSFTPKGFLLRSDAWADQCSFELDTYLPEAGALPTWYQSDDACPMYYTFASAEEPGAIAHNQTTAKTYYVWVMPHRYSSTGAANVQVILKGTSSRPETATYKDYTNTWYTDYTTEGKTSQGKVTQGKVHPLIVKATNRVALPIEYVTEYNLAGGEGLTDRITNMNPEPDGVVGPLRFAQSHSNDQSGYYNWFKVVGHPNEYFNRDARDLQAEIDKVLGVDNYFIPAIEDWWGVFLGEWSPNISLGYRGESNVRELMSVGFGPETIRQAYRSDYSPRFTSPHGGSDATDDAVCYAIRFKVSPTPCLPATDRGLIYSQAGREFNRPGFYPQAFDNMMKCAYRFRRVGGSTSWEQDNMSNRFIIDVVYLGEESTPTELTTISDESWWSIQQSAGKVISRTFSAPGYVDNSSLFDRGVSGAYWSINHLGGSDIWAAQVGRYSNFPHAGYSVRHLKTYSVRLFDRRANKR